MGKLIRTFLEIHVPFGTILPVQNRTAWSSILLSLVAFLLVLGTVRTYLFGLVKISSNTRKPLCFNLFRAVGLFGGFGIVEPWIELIQQEPWQACHKGPDMVMNNPSFWWHFTTTTWGFPICYLRQTKGIWRVHWKVPREIVASFVDSPGDNFSDFIDASLTLLQIFSVLVAFRHFAEWMIDHWCEMS